MEIRVATGEDLDRILELGREFNHLMLYQKDSEMMGQYLHRILVAEGDTWQTLEGRDSSKVVGYNHWIQSDDLGFEEMLRCYRQMPEKVIYEAVNLTEDLCVPMQGGAHREVWEQFIKYYQEGFSNIWCYTSIKSEGRTQSYKDLGFTFNPKEQFTFWNASKGDYSTYQLGRWTSK